MKPLELTWYPINPKTDWHAQPGYIVNRKAIPPSVAIRAAKAKRFTDAELAAEFHASCMDTRVSSDRSRNYPREDLLRNEYIRRLNQECTIHRFATLPDYDEVTP